MIALIIIGSLGILYLIYIILGQTILLKKERELENSHTNNMDNQSAQNPNINSSNNESKCQINADGSFDVVAFTLNYTVQLLKELGCQPEIKDKDVIEFSFQGENFVIHVISRLIDIWDPSWLTIPNDDPEINIIKKAVNLANYEIGPKIVYTRPENNNIIFHSHGEIFLHPESPENLGYLNGFLRAFFRLKDIFKARFNEIRENQKDFEKNFMSSGISPGNINYN